jgi:lipoprotein-anchoring transpeptidase ErfK/SrfK
MEEVPKKSHRTKVIIWGICCMVALFLSGGGITYAKASQQTKEVKVRSVASINTQYKLQDDDTILKKYLTPAPDQLIIINRSSNELAFFQSGKLVHVYKISTGKGGSPTPEGVFPIVNKIKNRPFYKFNIPGGDPRNPLGDRWLGLDIFGTEGTTYAIHGNSNPSTIGYHVSNGCVRMYNDDVRSLFELVKVGTLVIVQDFNEPWDVIALQHGFKVYV